MPLHTIVGFVAYFPMREDGLEPAGKELAEFVHAQLTKSGLGTSAPENREGWAWEMHTRDGDLQATTIIGLVDDMAHQPPRQWLITNDCDLPFFSRLFGQARLTTKREILLRRVCETLHASMNGDSRFSHLKWYNEDTFDKLGDVPCSQP